HVASLPTHAILIDKSCEPPSHEQRRSESAWRLSERQAAGYGIESPGHWGSFQRELESCDTSHPHVLLKFRLPLDRGLRLRGFHGFVSPHCRSFFLPFSLRYPVPHRLRAHQNYTNLQHVNRCVY